LETSYNTETELNLQMTGIQMSTEHEKLEVQRELAEAMQQIAELKAAQQVSEEKLKKLKYAYVAKLKALKEKYEHGEKERLASYY